MKALKELNRQADTVRARVLGAAKGFFNGLLLYGPPGVGKSHLVEQTLKNNGLDWVDAPKGITPQGLLDFFVEHGSEIMLFDDVAELFACERGRKYLMAATGNRPDQTKPRTISYQKGDETINAVVSGCIIILTNDEKCPKAFASRIPVLEYAPGREQVAALMREIVKNGVVRDKWQLSGEECLLVVEFLVRTASDLGVRLDLRDLIEKALPDYAMWKHGLFPCHWTKMARLHLVGKVG